MKLRSTKSVRYPLYILVLLAACSGPTEETPTTTAEAFDHPNDWLCNETTNLEQTLFGSFNVNDLPDKQGVETLLTSRARLRRLREQFRRGEFRNQHCVEDPITVIPRSARAGVLQAFPLADKYPFKKPEYNDINRAIMPTDYTVGSLRRGELDAPLRLFAGYVDLYARWSMHIYSGPDEKVYLSTSSRLDIAELLFPNTPQPFPYDQVAMFTDHPGLRFILRMQGKELYSGGGGPKTCVTKERSGGESYTILVNDELSGFMMSPATSDPDSMFSTIRVISGHTFEVVRVPTIRTKRENVGSFGLLGSPNAVNDRLLRVMIRQSDSSERDSDMILLTIRGVATFGSALAITP